MKTEAIGRQIQTLATVFALVGSYYAIRASLQLFKFHHLLLDIDLSERPYSLGKLILAHPDGFLALVVATLIATLWSVWKTFRFHEWIYPLGICLLYFLADRAVASIMDPMVEMISMMGSQ